MVKIFHLASPDTYVIVVGVNGETKRLSSGKRSSWEATALARTKPAVFISFPGVDPTLTYPLP